MVPAPAAPMIAAAIARKRRKIFEAFRGSSATTPENGKTLAELGITDSNLFRIQVQRGAIVPLPGEKYYLDENRLKEVDRLQYWGMFIAFIIVAVVFAILQLI